MVSQPQVTAAVMLAALHAVSHGTTAWRLGERVWVLNPSGRLCRSSRAWRQTSLDSAYDDSKLLAAQMQAPRGFMCA